MESLPEGLSISERQEAEDAFFGYDNSENSIYGGVGNDYTAARSFIPSQQSTGIMTKAILEPVLEDRSHIISRDFTPYHTNVTEMPSPATTTTQSREKRPRPPTGTSSKRGNYIDMNVISQSQRTSTYVQQISPQQKKRMERRKRRHRRNRRASKSSAGSSESSSASMLGDQDSQETSEATKRRRIRGSSQDPRGDDSEHGSVESSGRKSKENFVASKLIEKERKRIHDVIQAQEQCFACMWGKQGYAKVEKDDVDLLENFFRTWYGKMNRKAFCKVMSKLYRVNVKDPYAKRGLKLPEWSKEMIEEHLLYHDLDPEIVFTEVLHTFFATFMEIQNSFFVEKKITVREVDPYETDPVTGEPLEYEYEITKSIPDTRNIRCGIEVSKAMEQFFKLSNSEFAPERKRTRVKNLSPSLVNANRICFSNMGK
ncbi:MAG: hypothetical protein ACTSUE_16465 [Promethearchaeota archaeon]